MRRKRAAMEVRDSRRLTGPSLLLNRAGAVLDVACADAEEAAFATGAWEWEARTLLSSLGWRHVELAHRRFRGGFSLAIEAPIDRLYAATEANELTWVKTLAEIEASRIPDYMEKIEKVRRGLAEEANPKLLALEQAAAVHRLRFLWDDDLVTIGMGKGSRTWASDELPEPSEVPWAELHDIPAALVTGTNGKTTTVRLLAAMARAAGLEPGTSSTDGVWVAGEEIGEGDYSGPGGARLALRDRRVEVGLCETARGGILRRGLGLYGAEAALVTNVAEDHLGEWGVDTLEDLAAAKLVVAKGARQLVVNGDDPVLWAAARQREVGILENKVPWVFSLDADSDSVIATLTAGGEAYVLDGDVLARWTATEEEEIIPVSEVPVALGGAARHNLANALGAAAVAVLLRLPISAVRCGLADFGSSPEENPGRLNRFDLGGATAIVDFAHNPHGVDALLSTAGRLPAERRLVLVGQAGDRAEGEILELARAVWRHRPDRVIVKELAENLRGREPGEIPKLIARELRREGAPRKAIARAPSELEAVRGALAWARPGDLLLLVAHEKRRAVLELLADLEQRGWQPGEALPEG